MKKQFFFLFFLQYKHILYGDEVCEYRSVWRLLVQQITFSVESKKNLKTVGVRAENVCFQCFVSCLNAEAVFSEIFCWFYSAVCRSLFADRSEWSSLISLALSLSLIIKIYIYICIMFIWLHFGLQCLSGWRVYISFHKPEQK